MVTSSSENSGRCMARHSPLEASTSSSPGSPRRVTTTERSSSPETCSPLPWADSSSMWTMYVSLPKGSIVPTTTTRMASATRMKWPVAPTQMPTIMIRMPPMRMGRVRTFSAAPIRPRAISIHTPPAWIPTCPVSSPLMATTALGSASKISTRMASAIFSS